jgi:hypothetical protein
MSCDRPDASPASAATRVTRAGAFFGRLTLAGYPGFHQDHRAAVTVFYLV